MLNNHISPSDTGFFRDINGNPVPIDSANPIRPTIIKIAPAHTNIILGAHREEELHGKSPTLDLLESSHFDPSGGTVFSEGKETLKGFLRHVAGPDARVIQRGGAYHITRTVYEKVLVALRENPQLAFIQ